MYWPTWFGGARRVVATGIGSGRGCLDLRGRRSGGGFVQVDFGFELWEAPPSVDVLKLLNLCNKTKQIGNALSLLKTSEWWHRHDVQVYAVSALEKVPKYRTATKNSAKRRVT